MELFDNVLSNDPIHKLKSKIQTYKEKGVDLHGVYHT